MTPAAATLAVIGVVLGPLFHHLGVRAAVRRPFDGLVPRCESCEARRVFPFSLRCGACAAPIRRREPVIWLLGGLGMGLVTAVVGIDWLLPAHLVFIGLTTILVVTDLDEKLIPNRVLYPGTIIVAALVALGALVEGRLPDLGRGVLAGLGYFGLLLLVAVLSRGGFGMGDVKMAVVIGLILGFWGWRVLAQGLFLTGILGGIPALWLMARGRAGRGDELPYGPAMILGSWAALVVGVGL